MPATVALTDLLGWPVFDPSGASGRVREVAMRPQEDRLRIAGLLVKTRRGDRLLPLSVVISINGNVRAATLIGDWEPPPGPEGLLLLERVNDVDLHQELINNHVVLKVGGVDVGARGAVRRLLRGLVPSLALRTLL